MTEEAKTPQPRISYNIGNDLDSLRVALGQEVLDLNNLSEDLDPRVLKRLTIMGLIGYLQQQTTRTPMEQKLEKAELAYSQLEQQGMDVFKPAGRNRGPRKAEKIAALAAIKGALATQIEEALGNKSKEEQDRLLNHPKVLAKVEEMKQGELDL